MIAEILSSSGSSDKESVNKEKKEKMGRLIRMVSCRLLFDNFLSKAYQVRLSLSNDEPEFYRNPTTYSLVS